MDIVTIRKSMNAINLSPSVSPKVSVIIPIYNTASYLRETLESICNQSLQDLEIILINDGSTDKSQDIIEEYVRKDNRISSFIQPNQGQSVARNNGLKFATGEYIYFMDSDDKLDVTALKQCYEACKQDSLDFVFFDTETIIEDCNTRDSFSYCRKRLIDENKIWNGIELLNFEFEHNLFMVSSCQYFCNHYFLKKNFSGFPAGVIHEDHVFVMQIKLNAHNIRYIPQPLFKRRVRTMSTMTTRFSMRNIEGYTTVCSQIRNWIPQQKEWTNIINQYLKILNSVIWLGHRMTLLEKIETWCRFHRLNLSRYVTFRNWMVFWFKRK